MTEPKKNTFIINLIGTGCKISVIKLTPVLLDKLQSAAKKIGSPLEQAIFDIDFFRRLGDEKIKSISDISEFVFHGLVNEVNSHIEIRIGARKKRKIFFSEIIDQQSLLPLFNVDFHGYLDFANNRMITTEKEVGLIASFKIETSKIDLDRMRFHLTEVNTGIEELFILHGIVYEDEMLRIKSKDTVVTSNCAITT
jgi:hypothetical protein